MWWFKKGRVSPEVIEARETADAMLEQAIQTVEIAQTLGRKLERIREENHIAAAVNGRKL